jgi:hypothetical protein
LRDYVLIKAYPQDLPSNLKVDISSIKTTNDVLFVKDIEVTSKLEITDNLEQAIVTAVSIKEEIEEVEEEVATEESSSVENTEEEKLD